ARTGLGGAAGVPDEEGWAAEAARGRSALAGVGVVDRHASYPEDWGPDGPLEPAQTGWGGAPTVYLRRPEEAAEDRLEPPDRSAEPETPGRKSGPAERESAQAAWTSNDEETTAVGRREPSAEREARPTAEPDATPRIQGDVSGGREDEDTRNDTAATEPVKAPGRRRRTRGSGRSANRHGVAELDEV